ncbi:zinc-dependent peptidase [Pusillimonas sp. CC-YST705]|uniref:Zinc-dependent peptidase n=1 Tax=Mesopusillimonas faecipullorum TaxID=2755040 RepID=A0ABS8C9B9_9BURK|nr:M90 family metallopeptidase [Mesopusillimonas faecipullorum]MCB5362622.1 zinc-dependent peptidase [Mesopusillimonas faecipullorum]
MFRWLAGKGAKARAVERVLADIAPQAWQLAIQRLPFLAALTPAEIQALQHRAAWLLASKTFTGVQGFEVTEDVALSIALQAALPILELDVRLYEGWTEIIVYPGEFLIRRQQVEESGVVHDYLEQASGESWEGGPVVLSWEAVDAADTSSMNVVIHEFAHKLDLQAEGPEGVPNLYGSGITSRTWQHTLEAALENFDAWLSAIEDSIPADIDPESEQAAPWFDELPLDPYAASNEAEFFAVSSESFFIDPAPLAKHYPAWYILLARYYRQDPLERLHRVIPVTDRSEHA